MADADAVWFWAEDVVADLPTFPAAPVVEGDCACPRSLCERDSVIGGLCLMCHEVCMGPIPDLTAHDVVGEGIDSDSSERMRSAFNEIDPTEHGHRSSSSRRNGANPQN